jgi:hypothetical protein
VVKAVLHSQEIYWRVKVKITLKYYFINLK